MILTRLTVNNLGPFLAEWEVRLGPGVTVFVGEYEGAGDRSNRAGKSWLAVDVPMYVFFGATRGGRVEDLPHRLARGKEDAWAEAQVESSDGRSWVLRRGRTAGGDPIRTIDGAHVSDADLEAAVRDEVVGLSREEYALTMAAAQGDVHAFMRLTAGEKRRVVAPWFGTDRWVPRADLARRRMLRAQATLRALDAEEVRLGALLARGEEMRERARGADLALDAARLEAEEALQRHVVARAADEAREGKRRERDAAGAEVRRLENALAQERRDAEDAAAAAEAAVPEAETAYRAAADRAERARRLEEREAALGEMRGTAEEALAALHRAEDALREEGHARLALLEKYNALVESRTGVCPVLREPCDRVARDEAVLAGMKVDGLGHRRRMMALETEIDEVDWRLGMARSDVASAEEEVRELRALRGAATPAQAMADLTARKRAAEAAAGEVERGRLGRTEVGRALHAARKRLETLPAVPESRTLAGAADALREAREALREAERVAADARAEAAGLERAAAERADLEGRRGAARRELELTAWAAYAFGAAGIPSRELENAFGSAEANMNRVLEVLRTPLRVRFAPTRELKDWEPACVGCGTPFEKAERTHLCRLCGAPRRRKRRDELRLEVLDGEHESAWELDSGGGKVLLSLGVRLGLAALPGSRRRVRCESLLVDEPDGALDEPNRAALHALLLGGLEDLGIRQVSLITHADVRREFRNVVVVHRWEAEDRSGAWNE